MANVPPAGPSNFSNYPRTVFAPHPSRPPGVYFEDISEASRIVQRNLGTWVLSTLVLLLVSWAISIPFNLAGNYIAYGSVIVFPQYPIEWGPYFTRIFISMIGGFILAPLHAGYLYMGVKQVRGQLITPADLFTAYTKFFPITLSSILMTALILAGLACFIVPMFYVIGVLAFVPILIVDRNFSATDAIKESYNALRRHGWVMFVFMFLLGLVFILGACACLVGLLIAYPIYTVALGLTYNNFFYVPSGGQGYGHQIGAEPPR